MELSPQQKAQVDILDHYFSDYGEMPEVLQVNQGATQHNPLRYARENIKMLNEGVLSPIIIEMRIFHLKSLQSALEQVKNDKKELRS